MFFVPTLQYFPLKKDAKFVRMVDGGVVGWWRVVVEKKLRRPIPMADD